MTRTHRSLVVALLIAAPAVGLAVGCSSQETPPAAPPAGEAPKDLSNLPIMENSKKDAPKK
jgi:hypothetical protein